MADDIEAGLIAGAIAALRGRAERQAQIAKDGTVANERGVIIRTGEAAIALRLAEVFRTLADELDGAAQ